MDYIKDIDDAERRFFTESLECREEGEKRFFEGYGAVFGSVTDIGPFTEEIERGAFDDVLSDDARGLFNHDANYVLGRNKKTMRLEVDQRGLKYSIDYNPNDPDHVRVMEKVKRGDISQSSFAFRVKDDKWETRNGKEHRTITKFKRLIDVSAVTYPAYKDASVGARSLSKIKDEQTKHLKDLAEMDLEFMRRDLNIK